MKPVRRLREDASGVASTVGTIMALLVFLTFLSLIVNQYVPVWMKDSEAAHMSGAFGQFGQFKSSVDLQMLAALMAQNAGVHYIPITTFSPVSLGVDGIPIFSSPTIGDLTSIPSDDPRTAAFEGSRFSTEFVYDIRGVSTPLRDNSSGQIMLEVFNRYYIPQSLAYENGALIRSQNDGQSIRADPTFEVAVVNDDVEVSWSHVGLFGQGSISGTTTEGIRSQLLGVDRQDYTALETDVWINGTTPFGVAWVDMFNRTLSDAFGVDESSFPDCPDYCFQRTYVSSRIQTLDIDTPFYKLSAVYRANREAYEVVVLLENDPTGSDPVVGRITIVRIQHAFVNIAIADRGSEVQI